MQVPSDGSTRLRHRPLLWFPIDGPRDLLEATNVELQAADLSGIDKTLHAVGMVFHFPAMAGPGALRNLDTIGDREIRGDVMTNVVLHVLRVMVTVTAMQIVATKVHLPVMQGHRCVGTVVRAIGI